MTWRVIFLLLLAPLPCQADNLGAIGKGLGFLFIAAVTLGVMILFLITFIVLAVLLGRKIRSNRQAKGLVITSRVLAVVWYLLAPLPPILLVTLNEGRDVALMVLLGLALGLPSHITSIVVLRRAHVLARAAPTLTSGQ